MPPLRSWPSWATAAAIFLQALVPLGQALPLGDASEPLIICTQFGPRPLAPDRTPADGDRRSPDRTSCLVCVSLSANGLPTLERQPGEAVRKLTHRVVYPPAAPRAEAAPRRCGDWPRAPPAAV